MVRGRHGRRRVRQPKAVPDDDEEGEPRRALADDPRGEHGDGDTRNREDPPKIALSEKLQVSDVTAARQRASSDLVGPAPPIVDFVDRVGYPSLDQRAERESREKPQYVQRTGREIRDSGPERDRGVGPQKDRDEAELQEPPLRLARPTRRGRDGCQEFDYWDSNIRTFADGVFDGRPGT